MALPSKRRAEARRDLRESPLQTRIDALVYAYRILGHTIARVNPLAEKRPENPLLTLREFGFSDKDLDYPVSSKFFLDNRQMSLREMIALLDQIYAGSIGAEFQHIQNTRIRDWVRHRLESRIFAPSHIIFSHSIYTYHILFITFTIKPLTYKQKLLPLYNFNYKTHPISYS